MEWYRDLTGERYELKVRLTLDPPGVSCFDAYVIVLSAGMDVLQYTVGVFFSYSFDGVLLAAYSIL